MNEIRNSWLYTIRWKLLLMFVVSAALMAAVLYIGFLLARVLLPVAIINIPINLVIKHIGSVPTMIITGIVLLPFFFFLLTNRLIRDLEDISHGVQEIAGGRFGHRIPEKGKNELGKIADNINGMSSQLDRYLGEITYGLEEIAKGRFHYEIPERAGSKLGEVASSINQMSRQLHHSIEEERRAEKTKNDLITGVSHDLRTPLTSILGFLEVIEEDRYKNEVELRYYITIVYEKSLTLRKLIDDLFEYTRINNGMPLDLSELDMAGLIRQLAEEYVQVMENADMIGRVDIQEGDFKMVADGGLLVRAYENLIANAIQYGRDGRKIDIQLQRAGDELVVTVTNYGEPIPEKDLPFIFDRFYRVDRSRSKQTGGTGLGLAITKSIIEVHGGIITARSSMSGTAFETRFPMLQHQSPAPVPGIE